MGLYPSKITLLAMCHVMTWLEDDVPYVVLAFTAGEIIYF